MVTATVYKNDVLKFIKSLKCKKNKSSGKKYFFDKEGYLVFEITIKSKLVFTHKELYPFPPGTSDRESEEFLKKTFRDLGLDIETVLFTSFPSEREKFSDPLMKQLWDIYKNRKELVPVKNWYTSNPTKKI